MKNSFIDQIPEDEAGKGKEKCNDNDDNKYTSPGRLLTCLSLSWLLYLLPSHTPLLGIECIVKFDKDYIIMNVNAHPLLIV